MFLIFDVFDQELAMKDHYKWLLLLMLKCSFKKLKSWKNFKIKLYFWFLNFLIRNLQRGTIIPSSLALVFGRTRRLPPECDLIGGFFQWCGRVWFFTHNVGMLLWIIYFYLKKLKTMNVKLNFFHKLVVFQHDIITN